MNIWHHISKAEICYLFKTRVISVTKFLVYKYETKISSISVKVESFVYSRKEYSCGDECIGNGRGEDNALNICPSTKWSLKNHLTPFCFDEPAPIFE